MAPPLPTAREARAPVWLRYGSDHRGYRRSDAWSRAPSERVSAVIGSSTSSQCNARRFTATPAGVVSGRKTGAEMARLYNLSAPTVSRIVAQHRMSPT